MDLRVFTRAIADARCGAWGGNCREAVLDERGIGFHPQHKLPRWTRGKRRSPSRTAKRPASTSLSPYRLTEVPKSSGSPAWRTRRAGSPWTGNVENKGRERLRTGGCHVHFAPREVPVRHAASASEGGSVRPLPGIGGGPISLPGSRAEPPVKDSAEGGTASWRPVMGWQATEAGISTGNPSRRLRSADPAGSGALRRSCSRNGGCTIGSKGE